MRHLAGGHIAAMQKEAIAQTQFLTGLDRDRTTQAEGCRWAIDGKRATLLQHLFAAEHPAGTLHEPAVNRAILQQVETLVDDEAALLAPEVVTVDARVGDPKGIVVIVAAGRVVWL